MLRATIAFNCAALFAWKAETVTNNNKEQSKSASNFYFRWPATALGNSDSIAMRRR